MSWLGIWALVGGLVGGLAGAPYIWASVQKESWNLFWKGQAIALFVAGAIVITGYAYQYGFEIVDSFRQEESSPTNLASP